MSLSRCWRLLLPHFSSFGRTKYALEALRLMFQCEATLSPELAHHVKWDRFVNTHGGLGHNIPCDLQNEHVNKLLKSIITNMGSNLTEASLRCAARSVTTLEAVGEVFDAETGVVVGTTAHSTRSDEVDVYKVLCMHLPLIYYSCNIIYTCMQVCSVVQNDQLLHNIPGRSHRMFPGIKLDPLCHWDKKKTESWIFTKQVLYQRCNGHIMEVNNGDEPSDSDSEDEGL